MTQRNYFGYKWIYDLRFTIYDFGFTILDLRFWIYDFGFTIVTLYLIKS
jgi:hypothetical protein